MSDTIIKSDFGQHATCIGFSEIDKYAIQIYERHYGKSNNSETPRLATGEETVASLRKDSPDASAEYGRHRTLCDGGHKNYGDCTKIDWGTVPDFDLLVGGFPCQAFSIAGKRRGFDDTRGTLFFEIARCLKEKRPRNFLLENVKGLLSHDNGRTFKTIITTLVELGYGVEWQVLNSKNYGVPQNRERVFIVGYLGGECAGKVFPVGEGDKICYVCETKKRQGRCVEPDKALSEFTSRGGNPKDIKIRRLTPTECERLQGFPDGWTEGVSDTQRYKCLGNAVTVNVIEFLIGRLL